MRLARAEIRNFRSIEEVDFVFEPRCRVLVGINESGKSNILHALSLLDPDSEVRPGDLREIRTNEKPYDEAHVRFVFALDSEDKAKVITALRSRIIGNFDRTPIIKIGRKQLSVSQFVNSHSHTLYEVDLQTGERENSFYELEENCEIVGQWTWLGEEDAAESDDNEPIIANSRHSDYKDAERVKFEPEQLNNVVGSEFHKILEEQFPDVIFWRYDEAELLPPRINIASFIANPESCRPLMPMFALARIQDIASAIEKAEETKTGLRNLLNRVAKRATRHLHTVWKEYKHLELQLIQNGDNIDAHIVDRYNVYDLARRSDGFKRFVSFLLDISAKVKADHLKNTLYLDDEPDVGLHPSGARHLRDELVKVSNENYVVYATHSIFMIDGDYLDRHLIVSKSNETTSIEPASESNFTDEEVLFNALGYSIFEHLKSVNIVFEGWRDKRLFEVALDGETAKSRQLKARLKRVGQCYAKGVKDIGRVTAMLELARRDCIILTDNDKPAREQQKLYRGYGKWLRYDQVSPAISAITSEDFIRAEALIFALQHLAKEDSRLINIPASPKLSGGGRLEKIMRWLKANSLDPEETQRALSRLKEHVFRNLKTDQIEPSYFTILGKFAGILQKGAPPRPK